MGVTELKSANNLDSNLISVGQALIIPGVAPSNQTNVTYVVQPGDSLWSIANANSTTVDEIVNLNDLVGTNIYVGQVLEIPNTGGSGINMPDNNTYTVMPGDTLYSIALKYNTSVNELINKNNLSSTTLLVGQVLEIPGDTESTGEVVNQTIYVVQPGDTLWSISRRFGTTVNNIRMMNNLNSDILSIGQTLII